MNITAQVNFRQSSSQTTNISYFFFLQYIGLSSIDRIIKAECSYPRVFRWPHNRHALGPEYLIYYLLSVIICIYDIIRIYYICFAVMMCRLISYLLFFFLFFRYSISFLHMLYQNMFLHIS